MQHLYGPLKICQRKVPHEPIENYIGEEKQSYIQHKYSNSNANSFDNESHKWILTASEYMAIEILELVLSKKHNLIQKQELPWQQKVDVHSQVYLT